MSAPFLGLHAFGYDVFLNPYGAALVAAVAAGVVWARRQAPHVGATSRDFLRLAFWVVAAGLIGARLYGLLARTPDAPRSVIGCGDLAYAGGLAGGGLALWRWCRARGLDPARVADVGARAGLLGFALGCLGCALSGCAIGRPAAPGWPLAFQFGPETAAYEWMAAAGVIPLAAEATPPLHPVALYEGAGAAALFGATGWLARRRGRGGEVAAAALAGQLLLRAALGSVRGAPVPGAGWTSAGLAAGAAAIILYSRWHSATNRRWAR